MEGEEINEHSYDRTAARNTPKPKLFSLTQSMNQLENINIDANHRGLSNVENSKNNAFKPMRKAGYDQNAKRAAIFPNLQRLQRPTQRQGDSKSKPFFNLLRPNLPLKTSTPPQTMGINYMKSQLNEDGTKIEPSCKSLFM